MEKNELLEKVILIGQIVNDVLRNELAIKNKTREEMVEHNKELIENTRRELADSLAEIKNS